MLVPDPPARRARSGASCGPADASRSRSGGRASATRGSGSSSTPSARRSAQPVPPPGIPGPFSLDDAGRLAGLLADAGLADVAVGELADAAARRARSRVVDADVRARRAAREAARVAARGTPRRHCAAACARRSAPYETPAGLEFPGVTLIASARRA